MDVHFLYWKPIAEAYGWPEIIETDDPERGGKLVTFVHKLLEDKRLVADSIQSYVWGLRWKMKLAHQADPVYGLCQTYKTIHTQPLSVCICAARQVLIP